MNLADGQILPDQAPPAWGFTSKRFTEDSYLWKEGDRILVSLIIARRQGKGHFSLLVKAIEAAGFRVAVPTPIGQMPAILKKWGFTPSFEYSEEMSEHVEVWQRP